VSSTICTLGRSLLISLAALRPSTSGIAKSRIIVETTLGRFRDGSFGQCVSCGNEIGQARLEAVPWTPYRIQCQEAFER
jgi:RNA polymerase-binding transcription factor DksA